MSDHLGGFAASLPSLLDLLTLTGLPVALYDNAESPSTRSAQYDARVGALTHRVLAENMTALRGLSAPQQRRLLRDAADALPLSRSLGRQDKAKFTIDGYCIQYLQHHLPQEDVTYLGGNVALGTGRVDLLWRTPKGGVLIDEIKTSRQPISDVDDETRTQVNRYLQAGTIRFGGDFLGVRLLTLGNALGCRWITPDGRARSLTSLSVTERHSA